MSVWSSLQSTTRDQHVQEWGWMQVFFSVTCNLFILALREHWCRSTGLRLWDFVVAANPKEAKRKGSVIAGLIWSKSPFVVLVACTGRWTHNVPWNTVSAQSTKVEKQWRRIALISHQDFMPTLVWSVLRSYRENLKEPLPYLEDWYPLSPETWPQVALRRIIFWLLCFDRRSLCDRNERILLCTVVFLGPVESQLWSLVILTVVHAMSSSRGKRSSGFFQVILGKLDSWVGRYLTTFVCICWANLWTTFSIEVILTTGWDWGRASCLFGHFTRMFFLPQRRLNNVSVIPTRNQRRGYHQRNIPKMWKEPSGRWDASWPFSDWKEKSSLCGRGTSPDAILISLESISFATSLILSWVFPKLYLA